MTNEYQALMHLRSSPGWPVLQALWAIQHQKIVEAMRKAGKSNKELNWRYYAGQNEGFELALTQVDRALSDMEKARETAPETAEAQKQVEDLLRKVRGDEPS
jgi:hypothetical protein